MAKLTLSEYMAQIDRAVSRAVGLSVHDLPDCPFADWHESNVSVATAAKRAIKRAGADMF